MQGSDQPFDKWIEGLRTGDVLALGDFMQRYRPALERLAAGRIRPGLRRRVGPETIAQSVCRTFLRRVEAGQFDLVDGDALWRLLCAIALTKVREQVRHHGRQKRSAAREVGLEGVAAPRARGPLPDEAAAFAEQLERQVASFSDEERLVFDLRLQERGQLEIAQALGISERTVRRILRRLEVRLRAALSA